MTYCRIYENKEKITDKLLKQRWERIKLWENNATVKELHKYDDNLPWLIWCDGERHGKDKCVEIGFDCGECPIHKARRLGEVIEEEKEKIKEDIPGKRFMTFENFKGYKKEKGQISKFIKDEKFRTLIIYGLTARGKTHLARALQYQNTNDGVTVEFILSTELSKVFLEAGSWNQNIEEKMAAKKKLNRLKSAEYIIIDDLGEERDTKSGHFKEQLFEFWERKKGRCIITTNLKIYENTIFEGLIFEEKEKSLNLKYGQRLMRRFLENSQIVVLTGPAYNEKKGG